MGSLLSLIIGINVVILVFWISDAQGTEAAHLFDHVLGVYAFQSYTKHHKTGFLYRVSLPANFSGIRADTVRFRCGSLRRYGAKVKEFQLAMGVMVQPCVERVLIVRQNLGKNWSSIYYDNYNAPGYQLVSPILGLLAFDATNLNSTSPSQVRIFAQNKPIKVDFTNVTKIKTPDGIRPLCASFDSNGKMSLSDQISSNVCVTARDGHFGLVVEEASLSQTRSKVSRWKVIVGSTIGGALGAFLLGLLFIALIVKVKKRSQMVEMERRAYEEEALQISMVGHVRAYVATVTRTLPTLEHDYIPPP